MGLCCRGMGVATPCPHPGPGMQPGAHGDESPEGQAEPGAVARAPRFVGTFPGPQRGRFSPNPAEKSLSFPPMPQGPARQRQRLLAKS